MRDAIDREDLRELQEQVHTRMKTAVGGTGRAVALRMRRSEAQVSRWGSGERVMSIVDLADAVDAFGPEVLQPLAERIFADVVPRLVKAPADARLKAAELGATVATLSMEVHAAHADGNVDDLELARMEMAIEDAQRKLHELRAGLRRVG